MRKEKTYIDKVLRLLEKGAEGLFTKQEIEEHIEEQGLQGVHAFGPSGGLFETSNRTGKARLSPRGLDLLM